MTNAPRLLLGRTPEQRVLAELITGARNGVSSALLIRGEPGIGKTALLHDLAGRVRGVELIRLDGFEAEASIPYAGVQRLMSPLHRHLDSVPERQRQALLVATGSHQGPAPDRFLVGLGLLGLLAEAGDAKPVVWLIDDAHWLDSESLDVLAFVARRLKAESVAVVLALRDDHHLEAQLAGIPSLRLTGLDQSSAVVLLNASLAPGLDPLVAARIARSTGGNPLALLDLAEELSIKQLTESSLAEEPLPIGHHLEAYYVRQVRQTTPDAQAWLLVAAADSTGHLDLIRRATVRLGVTEQAADQAEEARLVELGSAVTFRHPLVRAAVYNAASGTERRRTHSALSDAAAELDLVELGAWHAAQAEIGPAPAVADRLEDVADRARRRGGFASRAKVLARAAELTPTGPLRNNRLVEAAEAALVAGAAQVGLELIEAVDEQTLDRRHRCRLIAVRAAFALFTPDPAQLVWGTARALEGAALVHGVDPALEQTMLVRAFEYLLPSERLTAGVTQPELGRRLRAGAEVADGPRALILRGLSAHILLPYGEAVPVMRAAVDTVLGLEDDELLLLGSVSVALTTALWDLGARETCLLRVADAARDAGALQLLDSALWTLSLAELTGGTPRRAGQYVEQVRELRRAIGYEAEHVVNAAYLAWIGAPRAQVEALAEAMGAAGFGGIQSSAVAALAVLDLAEGHYRDAHARLKPLIDEPFLQVTPLQYPDFVEAAVRGGHPAEAHGPVEILEARADANGSAWTLGLAARSRALITPDPAAEASYREAIDTLGSAGSAVDLARAELLYGEWLRRRRRRREARPYLRRALESFEAGGAAPFAQRARAELEATGEPVDVEAIPGFDLTTQEATVARLAAQGRTNAEIGSTLFISVNTVDYHLRKVFQKLGISSRRQLAERLPRLGPG